MTTDQTTTAPARPEVVLPPYSGDDTPCPKCRYLEASTTYRPRLAAVLPQLFNGQCRTGRFPERMERQCGRCAYRWEEALPVDDQADGGLSVEDVVRALDDTTPYPIELRVDILRFMAARLLERVVVFPIPEHPLWQPEEPAPDPVAPTDPSTLVRPDDDDRPPQGSTPDEEPGPGGRPDAEDARPHPVSSEDTIRPGADGPADEARTQRREEVRQAVTSAFLDDDPKLIAVAGLDDDEEPRR